jgi:hypothetical protein
MTNDRPLVPDMIRQSVQLCVAGRYAYVCVYTHTHTHTRMGAASAINEREFYSARIKSLDAASLGSARSDREKPRAF